MAEPLRWNHGDAALMQWITDHGLDPHDVTDMSSDNGRLATAEVLTRNANGGFVFKVRRPLPHTAVTGAGARQKFHGIPIEDPS